MSAQKSLENLLANHLSVLEPERETLDKPVQEVLAVYVELFDLLMRKQSFDDLQKALVSLDAYKKLNKCAVRDARRGHRDRTEICDIAIKVLSWIWFRTNSMNKSEKESAVDTLMEIFFSCEQAGGGKTMISTAQVCVWGLASIGGRFPSESGRIKRVLEVAALSNHGNTFTSDRIHCESVRLLKNLAVNNLELIRSNITEWIVPVLRSLCNKVDKISSIALDALTAGMTAVWASLESVETKLARDEVTWNLISEITTSCLSDSIGSKRRVQVASFLGIVILVFGKTLKVTPDMKLNALMKVAESFLSEASPERLAMLRTWKYVVESFAQDNTILKCVKILLKPIREVFRVGKEPEAKVRREAFVTWSYLACAFLELLAHRTAIACETTVSSSNKELVKEVMKPLLRALGDYDSQVRGPAVVFAVALIKRLQSQESSTKLTFERDQDDMQDALLSNRKLRRMKMLDSAPLDFSMIHQNVELSSFLDFTCLCDLLDATLRSYNDLDATQLMDLFKITVPIWVAALTKPASTQNHHAVASSGSASVSSSQTHMSVSDSFAVRALGSLRTLHSDHVVIVLNGLVESVTAVATTNSGSNGESSSPVSPAIAKMFRRAAVLRVSAAQLLDWVFSYRDELSSREFQNWLESVRLMDDHILKLVSVTQIRYHFADCKHQAEVWLAVSRSLFRHRQLDNEVKSMPFGTLTDLTEWLFIVASNSEWSARLDEKDDEMLSDVTLEWNKGYDIVLAQDTSRALGLLSDILDRVTLASLTCLIASIIKKMVTHFPLKPLSYSTDKDLMDITNFLAKILREAERMGKGMTSQKPFELLLDTCETLITHSIECVDAKKCELIDTTLFAPAMSSEALIKRVFPHVFVVQIRKQQAQAELVRSFQNAMVCGLTSSDKGTRGLAVEVWNQAMDGNSEKQSFPVHLFDALQKASRDFVVKGLPSVAAVNESPAVVPGRANVATPSSMKRAFVVEGAASALSLSIGKPSPASSSTPATHTLLTNTSSTNSNSKRPRISEKKEKPQLGVVTYTNLDPSQSIYHLGGASASQAADEVENEHLAKITASPSKGDVLPTQSQVHHHILQEALRQRAIGQGDDEDSVAHVLEDIKSLSARLNRMKQVVASESERQQVVDASLGLIQELFLTVSSMGR